MPNQYHNERGEFSSRDGMNSAIQRTADAGDYTAMWALKDSLAEIDKNTEVKSQTKQAVTGKPSLKATRVKKSFFADATTLDKRSASSDKTTSVEGLSELSKSKDVITRVGVGGNSSASIVTLTELASDKDWGVRASVAKNISTPTEIRTVLASDENSWVRDAAKL